jgi:two-component system, LytTR family, response regulator
MIRAIIVDDEANARRTMLAMLKDYATEVQVVAEASSVETAIQAITLHDPDLVFLDIEMQDGTGFDVLRSLPEINFKIVFITAYEQYALQSFRFAALDYLLKPVRIQELQEAIQRVGVREKSQIKTGKEFGEIKKRIDALGSTGQLVLVSELDGFSIARYDDILYCEAAKNYTVFVFLGGRKIIASRTIKEYEELLAEYGFMRIHKSYIINLTKVARYVKGRGGEIELMDGSIMPVSRERKQEFLDHFEARFGSI